MTEAEELDLLFALVLPFMGKDGKRDFTKVLKECFQNIDFSYINEDWFMGTTAVLLRYNSNAEKKKHYVGDTTIIKETYKSIHITTMVMILEGEIPFGEDGLKRFITLIREHGRNP